MRFILIILVGFLSGFVASAFGYGFDEPKYWAISLPIIVFGNLLISIALKGKP